MITQPITVKGVAFCVRKKEGSISFIKLVN
nr:MAG TPA: hypothetical protein [Caudoviricetes sp.]